MEFESIFHWKSLTTGLFCEPFQIWSIAQEVTSSESRTQTGRKESLDKQARASVRRPAASFKRACVSQSPRAIVAIPLDVGRFVVVLLFPRAGVPQDQSPEACEGVWVRAIREPFRVSSGWSRSATPHRQPHSTCGPSAV